MKECRATHQEIQAHYERLTPAYDARWRCYLECTLQAVLDALTLRGSEQVLDIGCGTGLLEQLLLQQHPGIRVIGVDVTPGMVQAACRKSSKTPGALYSLGKAEALPFTPQAFDAVLSANMLHHVPNPSEAISEMARVLKPSGTFVLVDWCQDSWQGRLLHYWARLTDRTYTSAVRTENIRSHP